MTEPATIAIRWSPQPPPNRRRWEAEIRSALSAPIGIADVEMVQDGQRWQESLAPAVAVGVRGVEEVAPELDRGIEGLSRLRVLGAGPARHAPHAVADLGDPPAQTSEGSEAHVGH